MTDSYAKSPLIMALAVYLDYNICVWRRPNTNSLSLALDCVFSAPSSCRQIHALSDAETGSVLDQAAHFSLLTKFGFKYNGTLYCVGPDADTATPHDWRLSPSPFETPPKLQGAERARYLNAALPTECYDLPLGTSAPPLLWPTPTAACQEERRLRSTTSPDCGVLLLLMLLLLLLL